MLGHVRLSPPAPPRKAVAGFGKTTNALAIHLYDSFCLWYGLHPINSL